MEPIFGPPEGPFVLILGLLGESFWDSSEAHFGTPRGVLLGPLGSPLLQPPRSPVWLSPGAAQNQGIQSPGACGNTPGHRLDTTRNGTWTTTQNRPRGLRKSSPAAVHPGRQYVVAAPRPPRLADI